MAYDDRDNSGPEDDPAVVAAKRARGACTCVTCGLLITWDEDRCTSCGAQRPARMPMVAGGSADPRPQGQLHSPLRSRWLESLVGAVLGIAFARVFGPVALVPLIALAVGLLLVHIVMPPSAKTMREAVVLQFAIAVWLAVALAILRRFDLSLLEVVALLSATTWLAYRPGWVPALVLTVYHVGIAISIGVISTGRLDPYVENGMALNLLLRLAAVGAMFLGLWRLRTQGIATSDSTRPGAAEQPPSGGSAPT